MDIWGRRGEVGKRDYCVSIRVGQRIDIKRWGYLGSLNEWKYVYTIMQPGDEYNVVHSHIMNFLSHDYEPPYDPHQSVHAQIVNNPLFKPVKLHTYHMQIRTRERDKHPGSTSPLYQLQPSFPQHPNPVHISPAAPFPELLLLRLGPTPFILHAVHRFQ